MAFDGPSPFDGDPAYNFVDEIDGSPAEIREAVTDAFTFLASGEDYYEVDETVWAWACAEMIALAVGRPSDPPPPEPFAAAAHAIPNPESLIDAALTALDVVVAEGRSEVAELWSEAGQGTLAGHISDLRERLET